MALVDQPGLDVCVQLFYLSISTAIRSIYLACMRTLRKIHHGFKNRDWLGWFVNNYVKGETFLQIST